MTREVFYQRVGATARAMAAVQEQRNALLDVSGRITCPQCGSQLRYTIFPNGISRGQCTAAGCIKWAQ